MAKLLLSRDAKEVLVRAHCDDTLVTFASAARGGAAISISKLNKVNQFGPGVPDAHPAWHKCFSQNGREPIWPAQRQTIERRASVSVAANGRSADENNNA